MTRQQYADNVLPLYQARRYLPAPERVVGIPDFDQVFPPDYEMLSAVDIALNGKGEK